MRPTRRCRARNLCYQSVRDAQGARRAVRRAAARPRYTVAFAAAKQTARVRRTEAKRSHRAAGVGAAKRRNAASPAAVRPARGLSRAAILLARGSALGRGTPNGLHQAVGRADEEVNPPDNPLAVVQPRGDAVFGAEIAAGPRGRDPRKESLERNTEGLCVERKWRSLSGKKVRYGPFVVEDPRV